jgi:hypothetical protein
VKNVLATNEHESTRINTDGYAGFSIRIAPSVLPRYPSMRRMRSNIASACAITGIVSPNDATVTCRSSLFDDPLHEHPRDSLAAIRRRHIQTLRFARLAVETAKRDCAGYLF